MLELKHLSFEVNDDKGEKRNHQRYQPEGE